MCCKHWLDPLPTGGGFQGHPSPLGGSSLVPNLLFMGSLAAEIVRGDRPYMTRQFPHSGFIELRNTSGLGD